MEALHQMGLLTHHQHHFADMMDCFQAALVHANMYCRISPMHHPIYRTVVYAVCHFTMISGVPLQHREALSKDGLFQSWPKRLELAREIAFKSKMRLVRHCVLSVKY